MIARELGHAYDRPSLTHKQVKFIWDKYEENGDVNNKWNLEGCLQALTQQEAE